MARRFRISTGFALAAGFMVGALGMPAFGQANAASGDDVLRGPSVSDRAAPGGDRTFGEAEATGIARQRMIPQQVYMRILRKLTDENTPDSIRATPEQMEQVREIQQEFDEAMREFRREHADEFRALRQNDGKRRPQRNADRSERDNQPMQSMDEMTRSSARSRAQELRSMAPKPQPYQTRMWTVLTEPQQEFVREEFRMWEEQVAAERLARQLGRDLEKDVPVEAMRPRMESEERGAAYGNITFDDVRERIEQLSPEVQRIVLRRMYDQLSPERMKRLEDRIRAPGIDSVNVPRPDGDPA